MAIVKLVDCFRGFISESCQSGVLSPFGIKMVESHSLSSRVYNSSNVDAVYPLVLVQALDRQSDPLPAWGNRGGPSPDLRLVGTLSLEVSFFRQVKDQDDEGEWSWSLDQQMYKLFRPFMGQSQSFSELMPGWTKADEKMLLFSPISLSDAGSSFELIEAEEALIEVMSFKYDLRFSRS